MAPLRIPVVRALAAAAALLALALVASPPAQATSAGATTGQSAAGVAFAPWAKLTVAVKGRGVVNDSPVRWVECPGYACATTWWKGGRVTLVALPSTGARFVGWKDVCAREKARATCAFTIKKSVTATAVFENQPVVTLSVARTGTGAGTVTSSPAGIDCGQACAKDFNPGQEITLTAQPGNTSSFGGWGGACVGTAVTCRVTLRESGTVTARFTTLPPAQYRLTVTRGGTGTIRSNPAGIDCGRDCSQEFVAGRDVVLTASPGDRFTFARWEDGCTGTQAQCTVKMDAARSVKAVFDPLPVQRKTLTVSRLGNGEGRVVSLNPHPGGIDCGSNCTQDYDEGTEVTLRATAASASAFTQWGGACAGVQDTCTVTMADAQKVTATFVPIPAPNRRLRVTKNGTGTGTVASVPPDTTIACGADCTNEYVNGTVVTLSVQPGSRSRFTGWTGACSGGADQPTCTVTMDRARDVTAGFAALPPDSWLLSVARDGTGTGAVASSPVGIDCGADCSARYEDGTNVTLAATPDNASVFAAWSGACAGQQASCTVTMTQARQATATFTLLPPDARLLTVVRLGSGTGGVVSRVPHAGINCGTDCAQNFDQGSVVTLDAAATGTSTFTGWGGACTGQQPTCTVTMDEAREVSAAFAPIPKQGRLLVVTKQGAGSGGVTSDTGGINCGLACSSVFQDGFTVTLSAVPGDSARFTGWTGACAGDQPTCTVAMSDERQVGAAFEPLPVGSPFLTVARDGTGPGTVISSPPGIDCGSDCRQGFLAGTQVTLTAAPGEATAFTGWVGACTGDDPTCVVPLTGDTAATATFTQQVAVLTVGSRAPRATASIRSTIRVAGPGTIAQRAVTGSGTKTVTWCRVSKAMKNAGSTSLTCNMGSKGRTAIRSKALKLSLRTTFTPTGRTAYTTTRQVTVKKKT